jgi:hypothetical protein
MRSIQLPKLLQRLKDSGLFPEDELKIIAELIEILVPKMHLDGHKEDCRYRFPSTITRELGVFMAKVLSHRGLKQSNPEEVHNT